MTLNAQLIIYTFIILNYLPMDSLT